MKTALDNVSLKNINKSIEKEHEIISLYNCLRVSEHLIRRSNLEEYHLSYDEGYSILSALPSSPQFSKIDVWKQREACAKALQNAASSTFLKSLERLKNNETNALVLRNFPVDFRLSPTPTSGFIDVNSVLKPLEFLLGIFENMQVSPVGYAGENRDEFIRHIVPSEQALSEVSSHGSLEPLKLHIDNGHLPIGSESFKNCCPAPNYIIWMGLRCDVEVPTRVVLLEDILFALPSDVLASLRKPIFNAHKPPSFGEGAVERRLAPLLVSDNKHGLCTRHGFAKSTNPESNYALQLFSLIAENPALAHQVLLLPGDVLIINNQKTVHARSAFRPKRNGIDRWLLRLYGVNNFQDNWMSKHQLPYLVEG